MMRRVWRWLSSSSIRRQLIAGVALVHMLLMTLFVFDLVHRQRAFLEERARKRVQSQALLLATNSLHGALTSDLGALAEILAALHEERYVQQAMVTDAGGRVLAHTDRERIGLFRNDARTAAILKGPPRASLVFQGKTALEAAAPVLAGGRVIGWAWVTNDLAADQVYLAQVTRAGLLYTAAAILIGTLFAVLLARTVTRPLHLLLAGTERLARNELDQPVPVTTDNEVGRLTVGFNAAMDRLAQHQTERQRAEEDLQAAKERAEEGSRAKSEFLATVSHELRTPMTVIMSSLDLMRQSGAPPAQRQFIDMADQAAHRLLGIIDDLLDTARIEAGRLRVKKRPFDLRACVRGAVEMFELPARDKGVRLQWEVAAQLPDVMHGDGDRLSQVLVNLIGNAVKFTDRGEVAVTVAATAEGVEFAVHDTGIGIPAGKMGLLFHPFSQVDSSLTRRHGGTGLGLAICRELVELMGGSIRAESEEGRGSTFSFTLPFALAQAAEPALAQAAHPLRTADPP